MKYNGVTYIETDKVCAMMDRATHPAPACDNLDAGDPHGPSSLANQLGLRAVLAPNATQRTYR